MIVGGVVLLLWGWCLDELPVDGSVVSNYGYGVSPLDLGLWDPVMAFCWLINGGLLTPY